jgi:hypothetical protein
MRTRLIRRLGDEEMRRCGRPGNLEVVLLLFSSPSLLICLLPLLLLLPLLNL